MRVVCESLNLANTNPSADLGTMQLLVWVMVDLRKKRSSTNGIYILAKVKQLRKCLVKARGIELQT